MPELGELIASGFAFGFTLTVMFWGLLLPIRWLARSLGLGQ